MIYKFRAGSAQWLETRQKYITATEASSLVGVNPYLSAGQMLAQKASPNKLHNRSLRSGKALESSVVAALNQELDWDVGYLDGSGKYSYLFTDVDRSPLSATPDAWRWDVPALVEAKTTNLTKWESYWRHGSVPPWYLCQAQVQMICTGMRKNFISCMTVFEHEGEEYRSLDYKLATIEVHYCPEFAELVRSLSHDFFVTKATTRVPNGTKDKATLLLKNSVKGHIVSEYQDEG
jgi:putative phage-type endonuclease